MRRREEKTPSKFTYRGVFCDMAVYGDSQALRKSEAFSKWLGQKELVKKDFLK